MAALELAHEWEADYLELDIQMTADGELVAFHDNTLERTSNGEGRINDHTLPNSRTWMRAPGLTTLILTWRMRRLWVPRY